jgi:ankyrin repeat protein
MKLIVAACFILGATTFMAGARLINVRSYEDLDKTSDVVVVARPVATKDTKEKTVLRGIAPDVQVVGVSTEFEILAGLKGANLKKLVVHHYRLAHPNERMGNAPMLAVFDPKRPARYLLFLQRESDGRYAPFEQVDPLWTSILAVNDEWEKMTPESYKAWMDAKRWLREKPDLGKNISTEITPEGRAEGSLHEAAMNGKLEKARALIKSNPDLVFSHESYGGLTPLQFAAQYGHKDVAELLLANKAEIEPKSYGGWNPLLNGVFGGHKDMVELLLSKGANVNYQEGAGRSPLHVAAENGYTDIAALLLAHNTDVNAICRDGYTALHVAAARGDKGMVNLLVAHKADYDIQDAAAIADLEKVKALLKAEPDLVLSRDFGGFTPLHWAVIKGQKDIVELLLANKADVNAKANRDGRTPLHMAVFAGHKDVLEMLLARNADVDANSQQGTPLHLAQSLGRTDLANLLRQHGARE